jgi:hypothetical protein
MRLPILTTQLSVKRWTGIMCRLFTLLDFLVTCYLLCSFFLFIRYFTVIEQSAC